MNTAPMMNPGELPTEYRARLAHEQAEATERRRVELLDLTEMTTPPDARIRAWERVHGLRMPSSASHPVLNSIAAATRLTLEQVHEVQQRRSSPTT